VGAQENGLRTTVGNPSPQYVPAASVGPAPKADAVPMPVGLLMTLTDESPKRAT
jgi:hypothetical protein